MGRTEKRELMSVTFETFQCEMWSYVASAVMAFASHSAIAATSDARSVKEAMARYRARCWRVR